MRYSIELKDRIYVKEYGFLYFKKKYGAMPRQKSQQ